MGEAAVKAEEKIDVSEVCNQHKQEQLR